MTVVVSEDHRERQRAASRAWKAANPERARALSRSSARAFREAHPDRARETTRAWKKANADRERARSRARHQARDIEATRARKRAHYAANAERIRELSRAWHAAHPAQNAESAARRRARVLAAPVVESIDREAIIARDGRICHICGGDVPEGPGQLELDHIMPLILGGEHSAANLAVAHMSCNRRKGGRVS